MYNRELLTLLGVFRLNTQKYRIKRQEVAEKRGLNDPFVQKLQREIHYINQAYDTFEPEIGRDELKAIANEETKDDVNAMVKLMTKMFVDFRVTQMPYDDVNQQILTKVSDNFSRIVSELMGRQKSRDKMHIDFMFDADNNIKGINLLPPEYREPKNWFKRWMYHRSIKKMSRRPRW